MSPSRSVGHPIRIIQVTDFHLLADPAKTMMGIDTGQTLLDVLDLAWRNHHDRMPALFLMTGDLAQDPVPATYRRLRKCLDALPVPCYCLPGNHDETELIQALLVDSHIACEPQILLDGWQIICLDSTIPRKPGGYLARDQLALLEAKLTEQPKRHALVCFHHSPLDTGAAWLDTMTLTNADELFALLKRFPQVKALLYGHIHQAMDVKLNGVRQLGCPSTCFQFKPGSEDFALDFIPQGYRWLDLYPDGRIETGVVRVDAVPAGLDIASGGY